MKDRKRRTLALLVAGAISAFASLPPANSQTCLFTAKVGASLMQPMGVYTYIEKNLPSASMCTLTMHMSVYACAPGGSGATLMTGVMSTSGPPLTVLATRFTSSGADPSCGWNCGCGSVVANSLDGLPVELMEFSVETGGDF